MDLTMHGTICITYHAKAKRGNPPLPKEAQISVIGDEESPYFAMINYMYTTYRRSFPAMTTIVKF